MQLVESVNIEKLFRFDADIVFNGRLMACVSAVNIGLNFGTDAESVQFPIVASTPTPKLLLKPSVYMCLLFL